MIDRLPIRVRHMLLSLMGRGEGDRAASYLEELLEDQQRTPWWLFAQLLSICVMYFVENTIEAALRTGRSLVSLRMGAVLRFLRRIARQPRFAFSLIAFYRSGSVAPWR